MENDIAFLWFVQRAVNQGQAKEIKENEEINRDSQDSPLTLRFNIHTTVKYPVGV